MDLHLPARPAEPLRRGHCCPSCYRPLQAKDGYCGRCEESGAATRHREARLRERMGARRLPADRQQIAGSDPPAISERAASKPPARSRRPADPPRIDATTKEKTAEKRHRARRRRREMAVMPSAAKASRVHAAPARNRALAIRDQPGVWHILATYPNEKRAYLAQWYLARHGKLPEGFTLRRTGCDVEARYDGLPPTVTVEHADLVKAGVARMRARLTSIPIGLLELLDGTPPDAQPDVRVALERLLVARLAARERRDGRWVYRMCMGGKQVAQRLEELRRSTRFEWRQVGSYKNQNSALTRLYQLRANPRCIGFLFRCVDNSVDAQWVGPDLDGYSSRTVPADPFPPAGTVNPPSVRRMRGVDSRQLHADDRRRDDD